MSYQSLPERPLCFIDVETTGLDPEVNEFIEFAAQKEEDGELRSLELKIKPRWTKQMPPWAQPLRPHLTEQQYLADVAEALELNGYSEDAWTGALELERALPLIHDFMYGCTIAGQNVSFDVAFVLAAMKRWGRKEEPREPKEGEEPKEPKFLWETLPYHKIDTVTLAYEHLRDLGLKSLSLIPVCGFLGIPYKNAHRAMADVEACRNVFYCLQRSWWIQRVWWWARWKVVSWWAGRQKSD